MGAAPNTAQSSGCELRPARQHAEHTLRLHNWEVEDVHLSSLSEGLGEETTENY